MLSKDTFYQRLWHEQIYFFNCISYSIFISYHSSECTSCFADNEESQPLSERDGVFTGQIVPINWCRLRMLRVNQVWRLNSKTIEFELNSFTSSERRPWLLYQSWYLYYFRKLGTGLLSNMIAHIIQIFHCISYETRILLRTKGWIPISLVLPSVGFSR